MTRIPVATRKRIRQVNRAMRKRAADRLTAAVRKAIRGTAAPFQAFLAPLENGCPTCGKGLTVVPWNKDRLLTTCNNMSCANYHKSIGSISKSDLPNYVCPALTDKRKHRKAMPAAM